MNKWITAIVGSAAELRGKQLFVSSSLDSPDQVNFDLKRDNLKISGSVKGNPSLLSSNFDLL